MLEEKVKEFAKEYRLSSRESEILSFLVAGDSTNGKDIADHFGISQNTVRIHIKNINIKTRSQSKSHILQRFIQYPKRTHTEA